MPINLWTGLPRNGKTLFTIEQVEKRRLAENREVYYFGIPDLNLPWFQMEDATKWNSLPTGSIIVIDEAQKIFRPRPSGSPVPDYVADLEKHGHKGFDIYLITQHPLLIDANVRRLTQTHIHVVRKFGYEAATLWRFEGVKENCDKSRDGGVSETRKYPKHVYDWYKSSDLHTVKTRVPLKIVAAVIAIPCLIAFTWYVVGGKLAGAAGKPENASSSPPASVPSAPASPSPASAPAGAPAAPALTPQEYLRQFVPLVDGLPHTAPRYANLTNPVRVPTIRGCWLTDTPLPGFHSRAVCMLDGGVYVYPPESFVMQYLRDRFFIDWENPRQGDIAMSSPRAGDAATAGRPAVPMAPLSP